MDKERSRNVNPSISVIIPTFNQAGFLPEALESIWDQEYQPLEIVVIDDGSTDSTPKLLAEFGDSIVSVRQENQGPAASRNVGLKIAHGELIAFLDSDDLWVPNKLQNQIPYLVEPLNYDYVMGYTKFIQLPGGRPILPIHQQPSATGNLGAGLYKKKVFDQVGGFSPVMRQGEDLEWHQRARSANLRSITISDITLIYRLHSENLTNNFAEARMEYLKMIRKSIDRNKNA